MTYAWSFDLSKAPRGKYVVQGRHGRKGDFDQRVFQPDPVILASKCGKVIKSRYIPDEKRWECFKAGEQPVAWMAWPTHPDAKVSEIAHPLEQLA